MSRAERALLFRFRPAHGAPDRQDLPQRESSWSRFCIIRHGQFERSCSGDGISKRATAIELIRYRRRQVGHGNMLVDRCCGLRAAIAVQAAEIKSSHAPLAEGAFECGAAVERFGCVISHFLIVGGLSRAALGH